MSAFDRDDDDNAGDYAMEAMIEKFRRDHPTWTEAEIEAYLHQTEPA